MPNDQQVFLGSAPADGTGDPARTAFGKYNTHGHPIGDITSLQTELNAKLTTTALASGLITAAPGALNLGGGIDGQVLTKQADGSIALEDAAGGTIADNSLALAKLQNASAGSRLLVRGSAAGGGAWQEGSLGAGLQFSGTQLNVTGGTTNSFDHTVDYGAGRLGEVELSLLQRLDPTRVVSVRDFGAVGDDATNDTAAINAAIDYINSVNTAWPGTATGSVGAQRMLYFPPGNYLSNGMNALEAGISVIMHGAVKYRLSDYTLVFWQIGSDTRNNPRVHLELRLDGYTSAAPNPYTNENFVGVQIFNLVNSYVYLDVSEFTIGAQFISRSSVAATILYTASNYVQCGDLQGKVGIDLVADGANGNACWITSCVFRGPGAFMGNAVPTTIDQMGIRIRRLNIATVGTIHSLMFDGLQFDCGTSGTNIRTAYHIEDGVGWVLGVNSYNEHLNSFVYFPGTNPSGHYFSARRAAVASNLTSGDLLILQPNAAAGARTRSRVVALAAESETAFGAVSITTQHWMLGHTLRHNSSGGQTITIANNGDGEMTIIHDGSGTLTFAASGSVQTGSAVTTMSSGEIAKIRTYDRGQKHKIWKV